LEDASILIVIITLFTTLESNVQASNRIRVDMGGAPGPRVPIIKKSIYFHQLYLSLKKN